MKNLIKILLIAPAAFFMVQCEEEERLVTYPESYPVFDQAQVTESTIMYGDSISFSASISDQTPLSTLEVQVVVNNEVVTAETIRTKGNSADINRRYGVPFVANRPDNARVKVYLSSINVDGYTTDTILSTTVARRPEINEIWIVPKTGKSNKLSLVDSVNLIYYADELPYGQTFTYRLATKVDKFSKVSRPWKTCSTL